jgi:hypothetical protein
MKIKIYCHGHLNCLPASESANVGSRCPGLAGSGERASSVLDPGMCSPVNIRAEQRRRRATGTHPPHESSHGYLSLSLSLHVPCACPGLPFPATLCTLLVRASVGTEPRAGNRTVGCFAAHGAGIMCMRCRPER